MTKRLTKEEFIKKAREVHGDKYDYSKVEYINNSTKVEIICPIHGSFFQSPSNHIHNGGGNGCPKCAKISRVEKERSNTEEFIKKAQKIHGDKYDYSKVNYINCKTKIEIICPTHGSFWQTPSDHLAGYGCSKCGKEKVHNYYKVKKKQKLTNNYTATSPVSTEINITTVDIIEGFKKVHGNKYDYSKVNYVDDNTKVEIICPIHGSFWQTPKNHLKGNGCKLCGFTKAVSKRKLSKDDFIKKSIDAHGDKYDYSKVKYVNNRTPVTIICPIHGEFSQIPNSHMQGCGCPECGREKALKSKRDSVDTFIEKAKKVHGDKYDYSKVIYINSHTPVEIICPVHGSFFQSPSNHLYSGQECPKCNGYKGESIVESWIKSHNFKYLYNNPIDSLTRTSGSVKIDFCISISNSDSYDIWIEYNGIQHYEYKDYFHKGDINNFKIQLERDRKVRDYCIINNIKLIEVPYILDKEELIFEFLEKTLIQGIDQNILVDYKSLYKLPD